jgi:hypothetical protein
MTAAELRRMFRLMLFLWLVTAGLPWAVGMVGWVLPTLFGAGYLGIGVALVGRRAKEVNRKRAAGELTL